MPDIIVRGLDDSTVRKLQARAKRNGRSLQAEVKLVLEKAVAADSADVKGMFAKWDKKFAGKRFTGSVEMIRQDRSRR